MAVSYTHLDVYKRQVHMWYTRKNKPVIKFTLFRLLLLCFLCSLFLGCGSSFSPEDRQDQDSGSSLPEREPWEGIYTANRRVLEGRWSESLFPEQEWEETKDCIMFLTKDTFAKYCLLYTSSFVKLHIIGPIKNPPNIRAKKRNVSIDHTPPTMIKLFEYLPKRCV